MAFSFFLFFCFFSGLLIIWSFGLLPDRNDLMDQTLSSLFFFRNYLLNFIKIKKKKKVIMKWRKAKKKTRWREVKWFQFGSVNITRLKFITCCGGFLCLYFSFFCYVFRPLLNYFLII